MLSEITQSEIDTYYDLTYLYVESNEPNKLIKQKHRHGHMEHTHSCQRAVGRGDWMKEGERISQRTCMYDPWTQKHRGRVGGMGGGKQSWRGMGIPVLMSTIKMKKNNRKGNEKKKPKVLILKDFSNRA